MSRHQTGAVDAALAASRINRSRYSSLREAAGLPRYRRDRVELLNWLAARAAVPGAVRKVHGKYHIPISNTAAVMIVLEAA